jgi:hypothetical protein
MQNDVVAKAHRRDEVIANINALLRHARADGVPVIWVQHGDEGLAVDSHGWQYVPELQRLEPETLVHKHYGDSFEATVLEAELARLRVLGAPLNRYDRPAGQPLAEVLGKGKAQIRAALLDALDALADEHGLEAAPDRFHLG